MVTDYSMPDLDGLELARQTARLRPGLPVLMLTGSMEDLPAEAIRAAGIARVATKPLTLDQLAVAIHRLLGAERAEGGDRKAGGVGTGDPSAGTPDSSTAPRG